MWIRKIIWNVDRRFGRAAENLIKKRTAPAVGIPEAIYSVNRERNAKVNRIKS